MFFGNIEIRGFVAPAMIYITYEEREKGNKKYIVGNGHTLPYLCAVIYFDQIVRDK